jgi:hypothetical protein
LIHTNLKEVIMIKTMLHTLTMVLAIVLTTSANAHGSAKPKHGGVVAMANDLSFELVGTPTGAVIYIEDHGKPMAPTGFTGRLTVLSGTDKTEAELGVAGDRLEAKGVKLGPGAKVVAALTNQTKKPITVRFTLKESQHIRRMRGCH